MAREGWVDGWTFVHCTAKIHLRRIGRVGPNHGETIPPGDRATEVPVEGDLRILGAQALSNPCVWRRGRTWEEGTGMAGNETLEFVLQFSRDLLSVEVWRIVLLLLLFLAVLVLLQIRRLLGRLVEEIESRPFFPEREDQVLRDDISIT